MAELTTLEKLKERRLDKMRQGKNYAHLMEIPSDPEVRVALVPLTEAEYDRCIQAAALLQVPDTISGAQVQDRYERREVIRFSMREIDDLSVHAFKNSEDMMEVLEPNDVNEIFDSYMDMVETNSPALHQLSEEEIDYLKKALENLQLNALSGKQLHALNRFIATLSPTQLVGSLPGAS